MPTGPLALPTGSGPLPPDLPGLWARRDFRRLWFAGLISQAGDKVHQIALLWWATETTHSPAVAGTLLMVSMLPLVLLSPVAGWLADRWGRRPAMVLADGFRMLLTTVMAWLAWSGNLTLGLAAGFSLLLAAGAALFNPASLAILPDVVDEIQLPAANSWQELTMQITGIAGPALGGVVVAVLGPAASFGANALSFLVSALLLLTLRAAPSLAAAGESFGRSMAASLRFLKANPGILWLLVSFGVLNFFEVPVLVYAPYYADAVFAAGATGYGLLEAAPPLGMAVAALWIARRGEPAPIGRLYPVAVLVQALCYLAMGQWPSLALFLVALTLVGIALGLVNIVVISHFQQIVPGEQLGRFMGLLMTVTLAVVPVSFGLSGALTTRFAPDLVLSACGAVMILLAIAIRRIPGLHQDLAGPPSEGLNPPG